MKKHTPWFFNVKPVHVGVYQVGTYWYAYWSGQVWGLRCANIAIAEKYGSVHSADQAHVWRGLIRKPK